MDPPGVIINVLIEQMMVCTASGAFGFSAPRPFFPTKKFVCCDTGASEFRNGKSSSSQEFGLNETIDCLDSTSEPFKYLQGSPTLFGYRKPAHNTCRPSFPTIDTKEV